jgi:putative RNA 2'-phosphotransferase
VIHISPGTLTVAAAAHGFRFTRAELDQVAANDKKRFEIDGTRIRAEGLRPVNRHDVHLSPDRETATRDGHVFHVSANGVWLTQAVPPRYLRLPKSH